MSFKLVITVPNGSDNPTGHHALIRAVLKDVANEKTWGPAYVAYLEAMLSADITARHIETIETAVKAAIEVAIKDSSTADEKRQRGLTQFANYTLVDLGERPAPQPVTTPRTSQPVPAPAPVRSEPVRQIEPAATQPSTDTQVLPAASTERPVRRQPVRQTPPSDDRPTLGGDLKKVFARTGRKTRKQTGNTAGSND